MRQPKGYLIAGRTRVAVSFPPALFDRIRSYADRNHIPFGAAVVKFCTVGLDRLDALEKSKARIAKEFA